MNETQLRGLFKSLALTVYVQITIKMGDQSLTANGLLLQVIQNTEIIHYDIHNSMRNASLYESPQMEEEHLMQMTPTNDNNHSNVTRTLLTAIPNIVEAFQIILNN